MNFNSIVIWVIVQNNADWDCFKTLISREILKIQNPLLEEHCAFLESHTFVPISLMCKKQNAVSHSSTESEIISLDTGLRLDGLLALELWDLIVSVLGNMTQTTERERSDLLSLTEVKDLKVRSTRWIMLIVFPQTSSLRIKKLCCSCLRTTKQWDLIVSVFGSVSQVSDRSGQPDSDVKKHHKSQRRIDVMENIDSVPSNVQSSRALVPTTELLLWVLRRRTTMP